jgi:cell division septation protein DedD
MFGNIMVKVLSLALAFFVVSCPRVVRAQSMSDANIVALMAQARAGNAREQFLLGLMYERGSGMARNYQQAAYWYGQAAAQNHALSQVSLGNLYDKGLGFEQSYANALKWYYKAAANGNADAMYFIGSMAYSGEGMQADPQMALVWFKKAADMGHGLAGSAYAQLKKELDATAKPSPAPVAAMPVSAPPATPVNSPYSQLKSFSPPSVPPSSQATKSGYTVQIASFKTEQQALDHWANLQKQHPESFANMTPDIYKKVFVSGRVFYRLNAGVFADKTKANSACNGYKANGTDCIVVKY